MSQLRHCILHSFRTMAKPILPLLISFFLICQLPWPAAVHGQKTWEDAFRVLGIAWNPDGKTLNRTIFIPMVPPSPTDDGSAVLSRDVRLRPNSDAYVRLYVPRDRPAAKLPLVIYFHGGDFVLFSASTVIFHNFCNDVAAEIPAVIVSVEYRLAPENRLPAAYDDALAAIAWARDQALGLVVRDAWMEYADFSRVFLLGSSSGANIAYHVALRALDFDFLPLRIQGVLLNQAFFGGVQRTPSELLLGANDSFVPLYVTDTLWNLTLPQNVDRDHEFSNPISGGTYLGRVFRLPKVYVKGDYGDPLVDRSVQLVQFLQSCGVPVYYRFNPGGSHGIELMNRTAALELYGDIKWFVNDARAGIGKPLEISFNSGHASQ